MIGIGEAPTIRARHLHIRHLAEIVVCNGSKGDLPAEPFEAQGRVGVEIPPAIGRRETETKLYAQRQNQITRLCR